MKATEQLVFVSDVWSKSSKMEELSCLTGEVEECVTGLDVGKESISKALTLGSTFDQSSDVSHVEEGGHLAVGVVAGH